MLCDLMYLSRDQKEKNRALIVIVLHVDLVNAGAVLQPYDLEVFMPVIFFKFSSRARQLVQRRYLKIIDLLLITMLPDPEYRFISFLFHLHWQRYHPFCLSIRAIE